MDKFEILAMEAGPALDALVHVRVMGNKCYHLNRRPVNPNTIRHSNAAKEICEDCGLRTYTSDFQRAQRGYSRNSISAKTVIEKLKLDPKEWAAFVEAFESMLPIQGTASAIVAAMNPLFVAKAALISILA